jgi:PhnB protein
MAVKPIPEGYHTVTPYLSIKGADEAIEFYQRVFDAVEMYRLVTPTGEIGHAEIKIGDVLIMLADEGHEVSFRSPRTLGGSSVGLLIYVEDVDYKFVQATNAGAKVIMPVQDQFYGDRTGMLEDPFGHLWFLATHVEDVSAEEIRRRAEAMFKERAESAEAAA